VSLSFVRFIRTLAHRNNIYDSPFSLTVITQCCIVELYKAGKERQPVVDLAKTFERRMCNHREAIEGDECLKTVVGPYSSYCSVHQPWSTFVGLVETLIYTLSLGDENKHRYVIATQSQSLRNHLRTIPAVPIVHIKKSVMILEPPSGTTLDIKAEVRLSLPNLSPRLLMILNLIPTHFTHGPFFPRQAEESALHPTAPERGTLPVAPSKPDVPVRRMKKAKGPNPLSVKKKKPKQPPPTAQLGKGKPQGEGKAGAKRKREDREGVDTEGKKPKRRKVGDGGGPAVAVES
jgi:U3 small nucleolar RNA-associated protein 23